MNGHALALSILSVLKDLFLNPVLYAGFALTFWDLRRASAFEREFFGIRATRALQLTIFRGLQGLLVGLCLSVVFVLLGVSVQLWEVGTVSVVSLLLCGARLRLLSPIYAVALLAAVAAVLEAWTPSWHGFLGTVTTHLAGFHSVDWLIVMAGILLAETVLLLVRRTYASAPVVALSKRGRGIGGLWTQLTFLLPLVIPTAGTFWKAPGYAHGALHFMWIDGLSTLSVLGLPVLVGFSGLFYALQPRQGIRQTAWVNVVSVLILGGTVVAAKVYHWNNSGNPLGDSVGNTSVVGHTPTAIAVLALFLTVILREVSLFVLNRRQELLDPLFAPSEVGVTVLTVLQGSLAGQLGLLPGERITQVNGMPVRSPYDVHFALNQNPAYAKLAIVDSRGELRFVGHTVYEGTRSQLGLIFAPDGQGTKSIDRASFGLLESLYGNLAMASAELGVRHSRFEAAEANAREVAASTEKETEN